MVATRDKVDLLVIVAKASAAAILCLFTAVLVALPLKIVLTAGMMTSLAIASTFLPAGIAALWMVRKLRRYLTRREARAVATAFAMFTPISIGIAMVLSEVAGAYASFWDRRLVWSALYLEP